MTATFDPALTDNISKVRQRIGDTDIAENVVDVQDETIQAYLTSGLTVLGAAATLAWDLVAKYAKLADVTIDDQLTRYSKAHDQYLALAERLQREWDAEKVRPTTPAAAAGFGGVIVTGLDDCRGPLDVCNPRWPC